MDSHNKEIEELASDFLKLMPLFRNSIFKPLEKGVNNSLTPMQFHALGCLYHKGTLTMSELASEMNVLKQQLTLLTDKLTELNYAERVHDKKDRRSVKISITQAGLDFLEDQKKKVMELVVNRLEVLSSEDAVKFHDAIKTINSIIEKFK